MLLEKRSVSNESKYWILFIDGEEYRKISIQLFRKTMDLPKTFSSLDELDAWFLEIEKKAARNYCLRLLSKRSYLSDSLKKKMEKKLLSLAAIADALFFVKERGYVDDENLCIQYIEKEKKKGWGPFIIQRKLHLLGVSISKAQILLNKYYPESEQIAWIQIHKEEGYAYFYRKGFSSMVIQQAFHS